MIKHFNIKIYGQVQGVSFRYYAQEKALKLGLVGFVKNQSDGTVYIEVEGEEEKIKEFLNWCQSGLKSARVEKVEFREGGLKNFTDFEIKF